MSEFSTDVLVAGAGAAGLAAALAAADRGLQVVIVEAKETFRQGSNTAMSTSMVPAGGSRWQDARPRAAPRRAISPSAAAAREPGQALRRGGLRRLSLAG